MTFIDISNIFFVGGGGGRQLALYPTASYDLAVPISEIATSFESTIITFHKVSVKNISVLKTEKEHCWLSFLPAYL